MSATYIWKPQTTKGPVLLVPAEGPRPSTITITGQDGRTYVGRYYNTNEGRSQYVFERDIYGQQGLTVNYGGQSGTITNANISYEGSGLGNWQAREKGSLGSFDGGAAGGAPFGPSTPFGPYGAVPAYLGGQFPSPSLVNYVPIQAAPYNFTDVMEFAKKFGPFERKELLKNNKLGKDIALDELNTELEGLRGFAPAAAALKRQETSLDNQFNLYQRQQQVRQGLPGVEGDLAGQRQRALAYASGRSPDSVTDRGLEIGLRSDAADQASSAGFGATSSVARKTSDLLAAKDRIQLSQYGDQLLNQNIATKSQLLLPPTEYSNAGQQISVMPSLSGSQLQAQARGEATALSGIPATVALGTTVQQNQFTTGLEQQTRQFNASNDLNAQQFNASAMNNFALTKFGYDVSYAGAQAGALQTQVNTQTGFNQQQQYADLFNKYLQQAQASGNYTAVGQLIGGLLGLSGALGGGSALASLFKTIGEALSGNKAGGAGNAGETKGGGSAGSAGNGGGSGGSAGTSAPIDDGGSDSGNTNDPGDVSVDLPPGVVVDDNGNAIDTNQTDSSSTDTGSVDDTAGTDTTNFESLSRATGTNFRSATTPAQRKEAQQVSTAVQHTAGVYSQPVKGTVLQGYGLDGKPQFAARQLVTSNDPELGGKFIGALQTTLKPFGVLSDDDSAALDKVKAAAQSTALITSLSQYAANGDFKGFLSQAAKGLGQDVINSYIKDPKLNGAASSALSAYNLFTNWGTMSNGQKALGLAALGVHGYRTVTGENLNNVSLVDSIKNADGTLARPGLTVGQGLSLFQAGYNVYALVKNWDQANTLAKITGSANTVASIASAAKQFGLLKTEAAGSAGAGGAGAGGGAAAGELSGLESAGIAAQGIAGVGAFALGTKMVIDGWGTGGKKGAVNGAIGGTVAAVGYYEAAEAAAAYGLGSGGNYYVAGAIFAASVLSNTIKLGKSGDQMARDGMRDFGKKNGLVDKDYQVQLADESTFDVGIDGHGGKHSVTNPSLLTNQDQGRKGNNRLNAWDIDYTNDLDFSSGMAGITLSRLLAGGPAKNVDQFGSQVGNAGLGNVGYGKEMSKDNFDKVMANQRAFYSKAGIKSREDAYQVIQAGFDQGRWNESDRAAMLNTVNMMYNPDGFHLAQNLMSGRQKGVEVAATNPSPVGDKTPGQIDPGNRNPSLVQAAANATPGNKPDYSNQPVTQRGNLQIVGPTSLPGYTGGRSAKPTKEELRKLNQQRYAARADYNDRFAIG